MTTRYIPKGWKKVNTRKLIYPHEDGASLPAMNVTMYLDPTGSAEFCFMLPVWVRDQLGISDEVRASTADQATENWKKIVEKYSVHVRTANATPVILLQVGGRYESDSQDGTNFGSEYHHWSHSSSENPRVGLSVAYELAFKVNGHVHYRQRNNRIDDEDSPEAYRVGGRMRSVEGYVLDYTPELHTRIDEIRATLSKAGKMMEEILKSENPAMALLATKAFRALPAPDTTS